MYVYSQTADTNNNEETTDGDDVPLLTGDPEAGDADLRPAQDNNMPVTTRGRSQTMSSDHIGHCSHREHFKFSFNIGLFFSLVFLMLEAIYSYEESTREELVVYLWAVRAVYYLVLLAATTLGLRMLLRRLPRKVSLSLYKCLSRS